MTTDYLEKENKWFEQQLPGLLKEHLGKWAVVFQEKLIGVYDSFSEAYENGIKETNSERILVRQIIQKNDKPYEASINITLGLMNGERRR